MFQIDGREISPNMPPYIIAEISANHNGKIDNAYKIIDMAKRAGAHAIKMQTYTPDTITPNSDKPDFILGENEIFGEMGVIDKSLRAGRADALSDANLIKISQYEFNEKLSKSAPFITGLTRVLVTRIRGLLKKTTTEKNRTLLN